MSYRSPRSIPGRYSGGFGGGVLIILLVVLAIAGGIGWEVVKVTHTKQVTFKVMDKNVKIDCDNNSNGSGCKSKYLIFTNHGVYQDTDSIWYFKFHSSDLYGNLQRGHTYRCKTTGFRIGLTSSYPNLISCQEVGK